MFGKFKQELAEVLIEKITPIGNKIKSLCQNDEAYVKAILQDGAKKASKIAEKNIEEIKELCGFVR